MNIESLVKMVVDKPFLTENIITRGQLSNVSKDSDKKSLKKQFLMDCMRELKIVKLPKLVFTKDKTKTETLGHNNLNDNVIVVYTKGRLMADVLRTVAHEMKHSHQDQNGLITVNSGNTGSEIENEANAFAGIMLRNFGKKHPEIFITSFDEEIREDLDTLKAQDEKERDEDDLLTMINNGNVATYKSLLKPNVTITESEKKKYDSGCLMVETNFKNWESLLKYVDDKDLNEEKGGKEHDPHVTILFGFKGDVDINKLQELVRNGVDNQEFYIQVNGMSLFENDGFDVLKLDVESPVLNELNKICKENFEHESKFPDYKPHITLAYLKSGEGKKYVKKIKEPLKVVANKFIYSSPNGNKQRFQIV